MKTSANPNIQIIIGYRRNPSKPSLSKLTMISVWNYFGPLRHLSQILGKRHKEYVYLINRNADTIQALEGTTSWAVLLATENLIRSIQAVVGAITDHSFLDTYPVVAFERLALRTRVDLVAVLQVLIFTFFTVLEGSITEALLLDALATATPENKEKFRVCPSLGPISNWYTDKDDNNHFGNHSAIVLTLLKLW